MNKRIRSLIVVFAMMISVLATAVPSFAASATAITLNKTELTLNYEEDFTLVATLTPDDSTDTVTWSSSDERKVTVDENGKVTAKWMNGDVIVTAKAGDLSVSCNITLACAHHVWDKESITEKASTCTVHGCEEYVICHVCGQEWDKDGNPIDKKIEKPLAEHSFGTLIPEVPANHAAQTDGTAAHYTCSVCNKLFDESKVEKTAAELVIKAEPHSATLPDWKTDESYHWNECDVVAGCGAVISDSKAEHSFTWITDKPATEDEPGVKHEECSVCHYKRSEGTEIPKLDHTHSYIGDYKSDETGHWHECDCGEKADIAEHELEIVDAKEASAAEDGYTGDKVCKVCGYVAEEGEKIPAEGTTSKPDDSSNADSSSEPDDSSNVDSSSEPDDSSNADSSSEPVNDENPATGIGGTSITLIATAALLSGLIVGKKRR